MSVIFMLSFPFVIFDYLFSTQVAPLSITPQFDDLNLFPATNPLGRKITSAGDFGFKQTERMIQVGLKYHFLSGGPPPRWRARLLTGA
jgi:hypothetical protein